VLRAAGEASPPTPHYVKHVVHTDRYRRLSAEELREASDELAQLHAPRGFREGIENIGQDVYVRKYAAGFTHELNRSVAYWLQRWQTTEG
jgi:FMN reductase (NADPH)/FMN reductase [NAD(P)H]